MKETKDLLRQNRLSSLLVMSLVLGLLAQWVFIGRPLGISWLIFIIVLLAVLLWNGRRARLQVARRNLWLWPALLFFATMVFWRANPFLTFLNVMATLGLLAFVFYFYAAGTVSYLSLSGILTLPLRMGGTTISHVGPVVCASLAPGTVDQGRSRELAPVLRGGVLALPVVVVFAALLASADLVFSVYLQRVVGLDFAVVTPYVGRGLFIVLVAGLVAGGTATAVVRGLRDPQDDESWVEQMARKMPLHLSLGAVETGTILILVSGLFLAFVLLQFRYLFGGEANIGREGFTYAEYARRGFSELVLVASLSLALILLLNWLTRRESKRQIKWFNGFSSLLITLVLLILVTAFWRMRLYEQAYGYTELRLIVLVFELWLGLLLVWFLITLWRAPERFAVGFLIAAIGFVGTLNLINPDALIVRHNLQRYHESGDLDMAYLTTLSADAVPLLIAAYDEVEGDVQQIAVPNCYDDDGCTQTMSELLDGNLHERYDVMLRDRNLLSGRAYHQARVRASHALTCFVEPEITAVRLGILNTGCG